MTTRRTPFNTEGNGATTGYEAELNLSRFPAAVPSFFPKTAAEFRG